MGPGEWKVQEGPGEGKNALIPRFCLQASDGANRAFEVGDRMRIYTEVRTAWFSPGQETSASQIYDFRMILLSIYPQGHDPKGT